MNNKNNNRTLIIILGFILVIIIAIGIPLMTWAIIEQSTNKILSPVTQANQEIRTQVSQLLHPTPTIIPDPITIINEIRTLARLETIQYSVEKVITAESGQGQFAFLFGDRLIFVAKGVVIAGVDLNKMGPQDLRVTGKTLYVKIPDPEIFVTTLDNDKSYVYDRQTGVLTHGSKDLETQARQAAQEQIRQAALDDGILGQAQINAENYLSHMLMWLGYSNVIFTNPTPQPVLTATPFD
jgi:Protein of unknown function (DUF4230)